MADCIYKLRVTRRDFQVCRQTKKKLVKDYRKDASFSENGFLVPEFFFVRLLDMVDFLYWKIRIFFMLEGFRPPKPSVYMGGFAPTPPTGAVPLDPAFFRIGNLTG